jgi:glycerol-3-phosphate dehydrogenase
MLLVGTTDTLYEGDPDAVAATPADVEQILAEASRALDPEVVRPEAVRATYAGLRVLPLADGETVSARRETVFLRGPAGMLTVAGGKLTTYRRIALGALHALHTELGLHRLDTRPVALPGAADPDEVATGLGHSHPELPAATRAHLAHLYGSRAVDVLAPAGDAPELLEPLHPCAPEIAAQVAYARDHEWAAGVHDVLRRRTTLSLRGLATPDVVERVRELLAAGVAARA